ncbi:MAG: hypothetical protein CM1200mP32_06980 [Methanobacteriota archaeon]|nr:MAG: hypothetical protein CM1200mP32_06980 [Euryarchaeota archaeon]
MEHTRSGSDILVRIDPGEEIHAALKDWQMILDLMRPLSQAVLVELVKINMATWMRKAFTKDGLWTSHQNW